MKILQAVLLCAAAWASGCGVAQAHFLWLVRETPRGESSRIDVCFSEAPEPGDPELLQRIKDVVVQQVSSDGQVREWSLELEQESLRRRLPEAAGANDVFRLQYNYGVLERGGDAFLLRYYATTGPELAGGAWDRVAAAGAGELELVPRSADGGVIVEARWRGQPLADAEVVAQGAGLRDFAAVTNQAGRVVLPVSQAGRLGVRVKQVESAAGQLDGTKYDSIRHYATLTVQVVAPAADAPAQQSVATPYPPLPELVTSFGAALLEDTLYVYGGHTGEAHAYWNESQANTLRRLPLRESGAWEALGAGPRLQGLALASHGGKLYRFGGFEARNAAGEEHDLWSRDDAACFDPQTGRWTDLPALPEPRSSFDVAVLQDAIYVVGGWRLAGAAENQWHATAHRLDLSVSPPVWRPLPEPPFRRRALAVAAHDGKIYAIGGMQQEGGPTTRVDVFDPQRGAWTAGPSLSGAGMDGFGAAAVATGGGLYVSTYSGSLQRLAEDGQSWELVGQLPRARFFHQMLPLSPNELLIVGGANMESGKFAELDVVRVGD